MNLLYGNFPDFGSIHWIMLCSVFQTNCFLNEPPARILGAYGIVHLVLKKVQCKGHG